MKKIFTLLLVFCVAFTALPFMSGTLTVDAASKITLKASAYGQNGAKLSWNKVSSPNNGYAVFRDGTPIKHYGKGTKAFTDSGLKSGSSHTYQIKTYKKSTKTQWYNKKTKKWQSKKPAKKYRGKSRKVVTYSYKKSSNKVSIRTDYAYYTITWKNWDGSTLKTEKIKQGDTPSYKGNDPVKSADSHYTYAFKGWSPSVTAASKNATYTAQFKATAKPAPALAAPTGVTVQIVNGSYFKISWNAVSGATGYRVHKYQTGVSKKSTNLITRTYSTDGDVTEGVTYYYTVTAVNDSTTSAESARVSATLPITRETKTVTAFDGDVTAIYKNSNEDFWRYESNNIKVSSMAAIDKTIDGEFTLGSSKYVQYHGATFNVTEISKLGEEAKGDYPVKMYNGDLSKFEIVSDAEIRSLNTYFSNTGDSGIAPVTRYYYTKNDLRIALANTDGTMFKTSSSGNITTHTVKVNTWGSVGTGLGIYTDVIHFTVKYDGRDITTFGIDTAKDYMDSGTPQNGMSGRRRICLDIAQAAMAKYGDSGNLHTDLKNIEKFIAEEYYYGEEVNDYNTVIIMNCAGGATVLETWSIWRYNQWGFVVVGEGGTSDHIIFRLNAAPNGTYYEAQGKKNGSDSGGDDDFGYYF